VSYGVRNSRHLATTRPPASPAAELSALFLLFIDVVVTFILLLVDCQIGEKKNIYL
jgi:hypothetical protein